VSRPTCQLTNQLTTHLPSPPQTLTTSQAGLHRRQQPTRTPPLPSLRDVGGRRRDDHDNRTVTRMPAPAPADTDARRKHPPNMKTTTTTARTTPRTRAAHPTSLLHSRPRRRLRIGQQDRQRRGCEKRQRGHQRNGKTVTSPPSRTNPKRPTPTKTTPKAREPRKAERKRPQVSTHPDVCQLTQLTEHDRHVTQVSEHHQGGQRHENGVGAPPNAPDETREQAPGTAPTSSPTDASSTTEHEHGHPRHRPPSIPLDYRKTSAAKAADDAAQLPPTNLTP